mmetsp:Transcript_27542/g.61189  ORF Transcript_27542/g.61189 Transcript_27542/m.61189 type:complete len:248 (-) Transcript_27542:866-1609(-)
MAVGVKEKVRSSGGVVSEIAETTDSSVEKPASARSMFTKLPASSDSGTYLTAQMPVSLNCGKVAVPWKVTISGVPERSTSTANPCTLLNSEGESKFSAPLARMPAISSVAVRVTVTTTGPSVVLISVGVKEKVRSSGGDTSTYSSKSSTDASVTLAKYLYPVALSSSARSGSLFAESSSAIRCLLSSFLFLRFFFLHLRQLPRPLALPPDLLFFCILRWYMSVVSLLPSSAGSSSSHATHSSIDMLE